MLLTRLIARPRDRRSSIEDPNVPLSAAGDWWEEHMPGGERSASGVKINHKTALTYAAYWRGINLISHYVAKIPLQVYRRMEGSARERATDHPAYHLVRRQANEYTKAVDFKQTLQGHALTYGNGYAYILRRQDGTPIELLQLSPVNTTPLLENGKPVYLHRLPTGEARRLPANDMLHIRGLGFDGLTGYDVVSYAKETLGLGMGARKFGSIYFANKAAGGVVLTHPAALSTDAAARLRMRWDDTYTGLDKAHKAMILEEGMDVKPISHHAREAQLMELRQFEVREIANVLGIPPHKLGDTTRTAYASLEQENQAFLDDSLDPWLCQWEEECSAKLLTERERSEDTHFFEFIRDAVVRANLEARYRAHATAIQWGFQSRDEVRATENLPPIPDGSGTQYLVPTNMGTVGSDTVTAQPVIPVVPAAAQAASTAMEAWEKRLVTEVLDRVTTRLATHARKAAKNPDGFTTWHEIGIAEHSRAVGEMLAPVLAAVGRGINETPDGLAQATNGDTAWLLGQFGDYMAKASEVRSTELSASVERACGQIRAELPSKFIQRIEEWRHGF